MSRGLHHIDKLIVMCNLVHKPKPGTNTTYVGLRGNVSNCFQEFFCRFKFFIRYVKACKISYSLGKLKNPLVLTSKGKSMDLNQCFSSSTYQMKAPSTHLVFLLAPEPPQPPLQQPLEAQLCICISPRDL